MTHVLKISDAANLAFHAMVFLAASSGRLVSNHEIATALNVSENHLSKVLQRLAKDGLVKSIRGPKGGFALEKPADQITLLDIFQAIDGPLVSSNCLLGNPLCNGNCILGELLKTMNKQVEDYFSATKISELTMSYGCVI